MVIGVPNETFPGERRVALIPAAIPSLTRAGLDILVETGAGNNAGFSDTVYKESGASIALSRKEVFASSDVILQVRAIGANPDAGRADIEFMKPGQALIGFLDPLTASVMVKEIAAKGVTAFAMELMPRISRAQSMDALSSMASVAGYKAVLLAAERLPRMFPMLMTAAGTVSPARVFVIGAGVAGLQAIATSRRLGAVVEAYDVRPAVRQEVESLGARFVELPVDTAGAGDAAGYVKAFGEDFYLRQRELMSLVVSSSDVPILNVDKARSVVVIKRSLRVRDLQVSPTHSLPLTTP